MTKNVECSASASVKNVIIKPSSAKNILIEKRFSGNAMLYSRTFCKRYLIIPLRLFTVKQEMFARISILIKFGVEGRNACTMY